MTVRRDVVEFLRRDDKYYLGNGESLVWAPPYPTFPDAPGFWDPAHFLDYPIECAYTWALLDESGRALELTPEGRWWRPDRLTRRYRSAAATVEEHATVAPSDVLGSDVRVRLASAGRRLRLLLWSLRATAPSRGDDYIERVEMRDGVWSAVRHHRREVRGATVPSLAYALALGADREPDSHSARLSEVTSPLPRFDHAPFAEQVATAGRLDGVVELHGVTPDGVVYLGSLFDLMPDPSGECGIRVGMAVAATVEAARENLTAALGDPVEASAAAWRSYFNGAPDFACSDRHVDTYYWYRWYGLRLNRLGNGDYNCPYPGVFEGVGMFRNIISYSAQCHMSECRWLDDPSMARGSLLNFAHNQHDDGSYPGHIYARFRWDESMYHANWGEQVLAVDALHPDDAFLARAYDSLSRYQEHFRCDRDREGSHLYDVWDQNETGQEYMSRYLAVHPDADRWGRIGLKGVDATVYQYQLQRALAVVARRLGRAGDGTSWNRLADLTGRAILELMWDPTEEFFYDVDPRTGRRTGAAGAVCFYPFLTDLCGREHLGAWRRLFDPAEFWTAYPVPASPRSDPYYSALPEWKGKRHICPWNGRTWPMANSHVCEALARTALRLEPSLRPRAAELIDRFVKMMFFDGDPARPNCFEHYNPETGVPSAYRGIDDYQHSWVVDLIVKYVCGIQPDWGEGVVIDPLPFGYESWRIVDVAYRGRRLGVTYDREAGLAATLDGEKVASRPDLGRLEIVVPA